MSSSSSKKPDLTPPASPTASYYDLSDDDEADYNTITSHSTGCSVKLLYSKSKQQHLKADLVSSIPKVYIHPSASSKDNIPGFIALVQQKSPPSDTVKTKPNDPASMLLCWLPESSLGSAYDTYVKVDLSASSPSTSPPRQSYLVPAPPAHSSPPIGGSTLPSSYAFALPLSQIYSLLIRPPNLGWWWGSVVVNTRAGESYPALFFHDSECASTISQSKRRQMDTFDPFGDNGALFWGGDEVLRWLRKYVRVEKSQVESALYLVEPSEEDLTSFIHKPMGDAGDSETGGPSMDPFTKVFKEARWNLLEKLTRVTRFTRRTAEDLVDSPRVPEQMKRLLRSPEVQNIQDEFDSARLYLARWAMGIAEQGERERQQRLWTAKDVLEMENSAVGEFEILELETSGLKLDSPTRQPVTLSEWQKWFDLKTGRLLVTPDEVKERVFHGGCADTAVRKEIWLWLLDFYPWDSTKDERTAIANSKRDEYIRLKGKWWDDLDRRNSDEYWRDQKNRIEKDVHRTDRQIPIFADSSTPHPDPDSPYADVGTNVHLEQMKDMLITYNELNPHLGYVQGMSDLLSPLYAVLQDDALAFWAFVGFMTRTERNFLRDQSGMRAQLLTLDHLVQLMDPDLYRHLESCDSTNFFFFFRMLLVWFKREFEWDDTLLLWETIWTNYLTGQWQLFIALAVLESHRDVIITHLRGFDEVLKFVNELSGGIEVGQVRARAEALWRRFRATVEAVDRREKEREADEAGNKGKGKEVEGKEGDKEKAGKKEVVVSLELRRLLSREVVRPEEGAVRERREGERD